MIYIAVPYTDKEDHICHRRYTSVTKYANHLMQAGELVFSPITHGHPIAEYGSLPTDWEYWKATCEAFMVICDTMHILKLSGWDISTGVLAEIEIARELGLTIEYVDSTTYKRQGE